MALTKISRGLLNTGLADSSDATAITISSAEKVTVANSLNAPTSIQTPLIEFTDGDNAITIADGGAVATVGNFTVGGNLTVTGTSTVVDTVTMNAQNAVVFEGTTADDYETTLSIVDPTADHTQYLLNQTGYIPVLAAVTTTAITSTPAELNLLDTAVANTVVNSKAVIYGSSGQIAATTLTSSGNITGNLIGNVTGNVTGNASGTALTVTQGAQSAITSLGTLTALTGGTGDLIWDTNTLVVDSSTDRVGIGTTSPAHKLSIEGGANTVIQMAHGSSSVHNWALAAQYITTNAFEIVPSTQVGGSVFTTPVATFKSTGNVGIGETAPQTKLHVKTGDSGGTVYDTGYNPLVIEGSSHTGLQILSPNTHNGMIYFGDNDSAVVGRIEYQHASNNMHFVTAGTERMRIDSTGNVGIGLTPETWTSDYTALQIGGGSSLFGHTTGGGDASNFLGQNVYHNSGWKYINTNEASNFQQKNGAFYFNSAASGSADAAISFSTLMTIEAGGDVGIGTSNPATTLHLDASGGAVLRMQRTSVNASNKLEFSVDGSNSTITSTGGILNITNDDIRFKTSGDETMLRAVANGAVELMYNNATKLTTGTGDLAFTIGNTSTDTTVNMSRASGGAATYQVMQLNTILTLGSTSGSTTTATHIRGGSQYTGSGLTVLASGNVGIGDTTPQALLDVGGGYGGNTTVATFAHATDAYIEIENMTSQNGAGIILTNAGTKKWTIQKDTSAHSLHIQDTSGDVMTFLQGGKVGIGVSPGDANLVVSDSDTGNGKGGRIGFGVHEAGMLQMYHASNMLRTAGSVVTDSTASGGDNVTLTSGQLYGPYHTLPRGQYRMCVKMKTTNAAYTGDAARITLHTSSGKVIPENRIIKGLDFESNNKWQTFSVPFQVVGTGTNFGEFYMFPLNSQAISVDYFFIMNDTDSYSTRVWGNQIVDGSIGVGITSPAAMLHLYSTTNEAADILMSVSGTGSDTWNIKPSSAGRIYINAPAYGNGVYLQHSATSWTANSDETLKENIISLGTVGDKLKNYRTSYFNWKDDKNETPRKQIGFIAQDWEDDFPEVVNKVEGEPLGMQYTETMPILLKYIQELEEKLNIREGELEQRVHDLEQRLV